MIYILDLKIERAFSIDSWYQRISITFTNCDDQAIGNIEIPMDDLKRYDISMKEPIRREDLAKALHALANKFQE